VPNRQAVGNPSALEAAFEAAPDALVALGQNGLVVAANRAAVALASDMPELARGIRGEEPLRPVLFSRAQFEQAARDDDLESPLELNCAFDRDREETVWISVKFAPGVHGGSRGVTSVCSLRDTTAERAREERLSHDALHDPLTGLANRRLVEEHLALAVARADRGQQGVGVLFLDLDGFKGVNDELGYAAGDAVLVEFAARLTRAVRVSDPVGRSTDPGSLVSRRGGDEFIVVLTDLARDPAALIDAVVARIRESYREPFQVGADGVKVTAAIGAAAYPLDGRDARRLVDRADAMMRAAKRER
jgi:diguanylate cyclase (GGDEF)-like protein